MRKLAAAVVALALLGGCAKIIGADFDDVAPYPAVTGDAGPEGGGDAEVCQSAEPIGPPDVGDDPGTTTFVGVISQIDFGEGSTNGVPNYLSVGFDVDGTCTGHPDAPKCEPANWTGGDATDGPNGEDNGVGHMLQGQKDVFGSDVVSGPIVTKAIAAGTFAPVALLDVSGWNGFSEDAKVTVKWTVAVAAKKGSGGGFVPKLDGTDAWPVVSQKSVLGSGSDTTPAAFESTNAYVNQTKLVAHFDHVVYAFGNVYMDVYDVTLQADVVFDAASQTRKLENGIVGGWAGADSLITLIPRMTADLLGVPLCTDSSTYADTKKFICRAADLATKDYVPGEPCDATSFGMRFSTVPATVGEVMPLPEPAAKCPADFDPANDTCDKAGPP